MLNFDKYSSLYRTSQVCQIVVLRSLLKSTGHPTYFVVANCHISYNVDRGDRKLAHIQLITSAISKIQQYLTQLGNRVICILCGDFNSTPSSGVFRLLTKGSYDCRTMTLAQVSSQHDWVDKRPAGYGHACSKLYEHGVVHQHHEQVFPLVPH